MRILFVQAAILAAPALAASLSPTDFAWQASLQPPAGANLARVELPVEALLRLQSRNAEDVRVFNAAGEMVPFARLERDEGAASTPPVYTRAYVAHPLFAARTSVRPGPGAVEVRVGEAGSETRAWVRWQGAGAHGEGPALQAAVFDTRAEAQLLAAWELAGELPRNALVPVELASSENLQDWQPVALKGPLFHFDGQDAPINTTLELRQPQSFQGRYLRLRWSGQDGFRVTALKGRVAASRPPPRLVRASLPPGKAQGTASLTWTLPFATPIVSLDLQARQANSLVPVRVLGRTEAAQPWRVLNSTVVYRLDGSSHNAPVELHGASLHALRVEANSVLPLPADGLQAALALAPVQLVFLASGAGPYQLAAGRADTPSAAVSADLLVAMTPVKLAELPPATLTQVRADAVEASPAWAARWLPAALTPRSALLWAVLLVGVLALAGVAYALLRQLNAKS